MSYPVSRREQVLSIPPLAPSTFPLGGVDFIYFHTVPDGVAVKLNGESESTFLQGETHQGDPGGAAIQSVTFINQTAGALAVRIVFGLGKMTVAGVATLSGAIPLPSGASTAALQTTGNTKLNDAVLLLSTLDAYGAKSDRQDTGNGYLQTLAAALTETARGTVVTNATTAFNSKKSVAVTNRPSSTGNITVTFSDGSTLELLPGEGASWSVTNRQNTLSNISVTSPDATTSAVVNYTS